jgi:hypothetical protein
MKHLRSAQRLFCPVMLSILAADLLMIYFRGGWYDPSKWIEITEVVLLFIFFVWGIVQAVMEVKRFIRDE